MPKQRQSQMSGTEGLDKYIEGHGGWWGEDPEWPAQDWRYEVACGDTRRGYWEWAFHKKNEVAEDADVEEKTQSPGV